MNGVKSGGAVCMPLLLLLLLLLLAAAPIVPDIHQAARLKQAVRPRLVAAAISSAPTLHVIRRHRKHQPLTAPPGHAAMLRIVRPRLRAPQQAQCGVASTAAAAAAAVVIGCG
jgi:hypothetical protein